MTKLAEDEYYVYTGGGNAGIGTKSPYVGPVEVVSENSDDYPVLLFQLNEEFYHDRFDGDYIGIKLCLVGKPNGHWKLGGLFEGTGEIAFISHEFDGAEHLLDWINETGALACIYDFDGVDVHGDEGEYDHYERNFYDEEELERVIPDFLGLIREPVEVTASD